MIDSEISTVGTLAVALLSGALAGAVYFGLLWLTVRRIAHERHPAILLLSSFLVRLALLLSAFYLIVDGGHWECLLVALIGFVAVRSAFLRSPSVRPNVASS